MKRILSVFLIFAVTITLNIYCQEEAVFEQPLLITSAGQSAEVQLASVLAKRAGLEYSLLKTATENDLGNVKTLVLVLGASLKGLGAAGLDMSKEKKRVNKIVEVAAKRNILILCMHLGGESRRGALSDTTIKEFLPIASMVIVVKSGNKDRLFTSLCEEHNIPLIEVDKIVQATEPLKKIFKVNSKE